MGNKPMLNQSNFLLWDSYWSIHSTQQGKRNSEKHTENSLQLPPDILKRQGLTAESGHFFIKPLNMLNFVAKESIENFPTAILRNEKHSCQGSKQSSILWEQSSHSHEVWKVCYMFAPVTLIILSTGVGNLKISCSLLCNQL